MQKAKVRRIDWGPDYGKWSIDMPQGDRWVCRTWPAAIRLLSWLLKSREPYGGEYPNA
jgi:hypothetical protein